MNFIQSETKHERRSPGQLCDLRTVPKKTIKDTRHRVESAHFEMRVTSRCVARDNKLFQLQPIFFSLNQVNKKAVITSSFFVF